MNADSPKRKNLGRGLDALFGEQESGGASDVAPVSASSSTQNRLTLDLLAPSPFQPRRHFDESALSDLAASIAEKGVLQPLLVRADSRNPGHYEIIAGERRWRAAQRAQQHEVPVLIVTLSDSEVLEVALIENLQRQDLSPVEEARGYRRLLDEFGHTQEQLGEAVGKSRAHVANCLRLLSLPEGVLDLIERGQLTAGQARPLIGRSDAEAISRLIIKRGLSSRQAERLAKGFGKQKRAVAKLAKDTDTAALEQSLAQATGYKVNISFNGKGGAVTIGYASLEQLDDIVRRLSSGSRKSMENDVFPEDDMTSAMEDHTAPYADPSAPIAGTDSI